MMPSSSRVWAMTETKNVRPRMNSIVSAWIELVQASERQQVLLHPTPRSLAGNLGVPARRRQPDKRRDDDQQHPVGERVLVDLVPERSEEEEPEDGHEHFRAEQPERQRRRRGRPAAVRRRPPRSRRETRQPAASRRGQEAAAVRRRSGQPPRRVSVETTRDPSTRPMRGTSGRAGARSIGSARLGGCGFG